MRILVLHNTYQQAGGEDAAVAAELDLLRSRGHEVRLFTVNNDRIRGLRDRLAVAWQTAYSWAARRKVATEIRDFEPDLVHVHNFFPLLTPSVYDACRDAGIPSVQTLHNYRTLCANALLLRNGRVCEDCVTGSPYRAVPHRCYRNSWGGTLALSRMIATHRTRGTWYRRVDRFIALSEFAKQTFVRAGFPEGRIAVKPNFVTPSHTDAPAPERNGALFVGRLSPEKGIATLASAWAGVEVGLRVAGEGPQMGWLREQAIPNVSLLGRLSADEVLREMERAEFLVLPSECYEGFPVVLAEAYSRKLPVIASRIGALEELVTEGETGLCFVPGDPADLRRAVRWATCHPGDLRGMGEDAYRRYLSLYTPEPNYRRLMEIYDAAQEEHFRDRPERGS